VSVKIKASFKKDERTFDGLSAIEHLLVDEDLLHERYVVVAILRPHRIDVLAEDGAKSSTVKFDHIEVTDGDASATAKALLMAKYKERTGRDDEPQATLFDGPDGEREVPEASGEEIVAELDERRAKREQGQG
jgi:hypothetical protein